MLDSLELTEKPHSVVQRDDLGAAGHSAM